MEQACIKASDVGLRSYKSIRNLVKTFHLHKLIRQDYAAFWEQHAAQTRVSSRGVLSCQRTTTRSLEKRKLGESD